MIYESALGGKTICVEFNRYEARQERSGIKVVTRSGYECMTIRGRQNPFRKVNPPRILGTVAGTMTFLNGVCRQLYSETAPLPYQLNRWVFGKI